MYEGPFTECNLLSNYTFSMDSCEIGNVCDDAEVMRLFGIDSDSLKNWNEK